MIMLKIGGLQLKSNLILSPMAGVSDLPFRLLNRKFGCGLAFVEMINARSISHKSRRTQQMLAADAQDRPLGIQLLGSQECFLLKAMDALNKYKFDILDFNAACPAKKVVRRGEGASLLKEPKKLAKLLKLLARNSRLPVTVKIRIGWDNGSINARDVALLAQDAGASALFIHGRTKLQGYSGEVDYGVIRRVKEALEIPVIASGNIFSPELVKKAFAETGCAGVAVARGALGNPWIFPESERFLKDGVLPERPAREEIINIMAGHLGSCVDFYGERIGVAQFRKFFAWYTKGFRRVRHLREQSSRAKTKYEMLNIIQSCLNHPEARRPVLVTVSCGQ